MKVLWFVNKPLPPVTRRLGLADIHGGGWLDGLEKGLRGRPEIQLAVASVASKAYAPFEDNGVVFYGLGSGEPAADAARVAKRWRDVFKPDRSLADCLKVVADFGPDLVHVHGTESPFGLLCSQVPMPSVISIQGLLTVLERMDTRGIDTSLLRSLSPTLLMRGGGFVLTRIQIRPAAERERRIIAGCSNFIGRTRFDEDVVRALNPSARYFPHDHRILRPEFHAVTWSVQTANEPIVYSTGGVYARKGVGTLLEAAAILRNGAVPEIRVRIGGRLGHPEEDLRATRYRVRKLGLAGCVTLLGELTPREIAAELCHARVFVLASHGDNSPNTLAEAMLVGTPCVASAVGGVPSLARDGVEALLVQDGDPYSLAGAMLRILSDDALASEFGRCARDVARKRHDSERIVTRLLETYRVITSEAPGD